MKLKTLHKNYNPAPLFYLIRQTAIDSEAEIIASADVTQNHHHGALDAQQEIVHRAHSICIGEGGVLIRRILDEQDFAWKCVCHYSRDRRGRSSGSAGGV